MHLLRVQIGTGFRFLGNLLILTQLYKHLVNEEYDGLAFDVENARCFDAELVDEDPSELERRCLLLEEVVIDVLDVKIEITHYTLFG
jgi:hypothetical protein